MQSSIFVIISLCDLFGDRFLPVFSCLYFEICSKYGANCLYGGAGFVIDTCIGSFGTSFVDWLLKLGLDSSTLSHFGQLSDLQYLSPPSNLLPHLSQNCIEQFYSKVVKKLVCTN